VISSRSATIPGREQIRGEDKVFGIRISSLILVGPTFLQLVGQGEKDRARTISVAPEIGQRGLIHNLDGTDRSVYTHHSALQRNGVISGLDQTSRTGGAEEREP